MFQCETMFLLHSGGVALDIQRLFYLAKTLPNLDMMDLNYEVKMTK